MAKNAQYSLVDYSDLLIETKSITENVDELYICDLSLETPVVNELGRISKFSRVIYIDHHPMRGEVLQALRASGVKILHSTEMCAGALAYRLLRRELPEDARVLAAYATLSDYPSADQGFAFTDRFEPQMVAFESTLLSYSVARACDDIKFKNKVVEGLSQLKYPHNIEGVVSLAMQQLQYVIDLIKNTGETVCYSRHVAYVEVSGSTGVVANVLVHAVEKPIVVCYRGYRDGASQYLSVRTKNSRYDLGALTSRIAGKLGGSGGGHPLAAGAQIPKENLSRFIELMDRAIEGTAQ